MYTHTCICYYHAPVACVAFRMPELQGSLRRYTYGNPHSEASPKLSRAQSVPPMPLSSSVKHTARPVSTHGAGVSTQSTTESIDLNANPPVFLCRNKSFVFTNYQPRQCNAPLKMYDRAFIVDWSQISGIGTSKLNCLGLRPHLFWFREWRVPRTLSHT